VDTTLNGGIMNSRKMARNDNIAGFNLNLLDNCFHNFIVVFSEHRDNP
jgi:hypothetical protein